MIDLREGNCLELIDNIPKNSIFVSDPPFNIGYKYKTYKDRMKEEEYFRFLAKAFKNGAYPIVIVHYPESLYRFAQEINRIPNRVISWVYNSNTKRQHRDIAFFGCVPDLSKVKQPYKNQADKRIQKLMEQGRKGASIYDWWNINQIKNVSKEKTAHPCQMPIEVMDRIIKILPDGHTIIDPFMGSGTTAIACKMNGRNFIGCELDSEYFKIAKARVCAVGIEMANV